MKKQKGFTLIELMVVMAIIAILATAGLSAYTGYIKKSRDTKRIEDVRAINTIIQGSLSANGSPPSSMDAVVAEANNGQMITDPLGTTAAVCLTDATTDTLGACGYSYYLCDDGAGYLISAKLESKSNQSSYTTNGSVVGYSMGSCTSGATGGSSTILVDGKNWMAADLPGYYQGMKKTPVIRNDWPAAANWTGNSNDPDYGDPCTANNSATRLPNDQELGALSLDDITILGLSKNGFLGASDGSLDSSGSGGYYWSSSGSTLYVNSDFVFMSGYGPAYGFSVRCLQD